MPNHAIFEPKINSYSVDGKIRENILPGLKVKILTKKNKLSGELLEGFVESIITEAPSCPAGIKVKLTTGKIGRVKQIIE